MQSLRSHRTITRLLPVSLVATQLCLCMAVSAAAPTTKLEKPLARFGGFSDWVLSLAFNPDGKHLAAGSYGTLRIYDTAEHKQTAEIKLGNGYASDLEFSPDGQTLLVAGYQSVTVCRTDPYRSLRTVKAHRGQVTSLAFSPDGTRLATASDDGTIAFWDVASLLDGTSAPQLTIKALDQPVSGIDISPDGKWLASASGDPDRVTQSGQVRLWNTETGKAVREFPKHKRASTAVAFSPDGKFLISSSQDETVNVYEIDSGQALGFFGGHSRPTNCLAFVSNAATIVSGSGGGAKGKNEVKIWNREDGEELVTIDQHSAQVTDVAVSPDGRLLATSSYDKTVGLWDISSLNSRKQNTVAAAKSTQPQPRTAQKDNPKVDTLRAGIIGLDTSHVIAFTKALNDPKAKPDIAHCQVVAAYPPGSPDIKSSTERVPGYTKQLQELDVTIVQSIDELIKQVDVVLLETNDGRPHLQQILPCLKAGKPVFIDKPIAGSLTDAVAIFEAARIYKTPVFSSSSLRYSSGAQALRAGKLGKIVACDAYSPCSLEATHPDLFWYGIHGVESLFTVMGAGCISVTRSTAPGMDVVVGTWQDDRIGTFRGLRTGKRGYGGTAFGEKGIQSIGSYEGYRPLVVEIVKFFRTRRPPVSSTETLEIYAFMEAADESKRLGGVPVRLKTVMDRARLAAAKKIAALK
ncbi:MAG: Gfo/Idh/MocA family oxidoreductase [Planctomycetaceae bacterium]